MKKGSAELLILSLVEDRARHGYDIGRLIETGLSFIPGDSVIARMAGDLRAWRAQEPDWRRARELLAAQYGYDRYGGN